MVLALTGGIGCGKSTAADTLRECGAFIIDADRISRELTAENGPALPFLRAEFGDDIFDEAHRLDRKKLGSIVFSDPSALQKLNGILHPMIRQELMNRIEQARNAQEKIIVLDVPLLFETGMDDLADQIICMSAPKKVQKERIMERDGLSEEEAKKRIASQMSTEEKTARSDYVISTDRPMEETAAEVRSLFEKLIKEEEP